jgi:predicted nucleotidyltransferase
MMSEPDIMVKRIAGILQEDERVRAAWLCGSRARGTNDEYSDIDIWLVVRPADVTQFIDDWPNLSDKISPTVLRQQVGKLPVFNHITPEWLRFDVSIGTPEDVPKRSRNTVRLLFDLDGLEAKLAPAHGPLQPDATKVRTLTTEFLRVLGLLPVVAGRCEYVVGASGVGLLRELLIQLMLQDVAVEDRGGALHLRGLLPEARLQALRDLPPIAATREAVIAGHLACAQLFLPIARDLSDRTGVQWPAELERAVREHLHRSLSIEFA